MDNVQHIAQFLGIPLLSLSTHKNIVIEIGVVFHNAVYNVAEDVLKHDVITLIVQENITITIIIPALNVSCIKKIICMVHDYAYVHLMVEQPENTDCILLLEGNVKNAATLNVNLRLFLAHKQKMGIIMHQIHAGKSSKSSCIIKGVVTDQARWWCENKIVIETQADQSRAEQKTYALLLSEEARFYGAPALEVLNQEVQCKHGSAVGYINDEHRFYIMARGLAQNHAEKLIIKGFLA